MRNEPAAERQDAPRGDVMQSEVVDTLDGAPTVRAWVVALAVVWLQVSALIWGLSVLP